MRKTSQNNGNSHIEYLVIFAIVMAFFILGIKIVGNIITSNINEQYLSGKKIRISIKGIYTEKVGNYGGTKTQPVLYKKDKNTICIDSGYLVLNNLPTNQPDFNALDNKYGAKTLRYYSRVINKVQYSLAYNPLLKNKAIYLQELGDILFAMANLIDQISFYNGKKMTLAMPNTKIRLTSIDIQNNNGLYTIPDYEIPVEGTITSLKLKKEYYSLYNSVGLVYAPVIRYDNASPMFIWLIKGTFNTKNPDQVYTLTKTSRNYISLNKFLIIDLELLRPGVPDNLLAPESYKYYNFLKAYNIYNNIYQKHSNDPQTNHLLSIINKEVTGITRAIKLKKDSKTNTIKVLFLPKETLSTNIVQEFYSNIDNLQEKVEK